MSIITQLNQDQIYKYQIIKDKALIRLKTSPLGVYLDKLIV